MRGIERFWPGVYKIFKRLGRFSRLMNITGFYPFSGRRHEQFQPAQKFRRNHFAANRTWDFRSLWAKGMMRSHQVSRKH